MHNTIHYDFTWDQAKSEANFKKHGISFEEAKTVWRDNIAKEYIDQRHSLWNEIRFYRIGVSSSGKFLSVFFSESSISQIRIISARKSTAKERDKYGRRIRLL